MEIILHLDIYIFPMILLACIYFSLKRNAIQTTENRLFGRLLLYTLLVMLSELLSWAFEGELFPFAHFLNWFINMAYFCIAPLIAIAWLNYVCYFFYRKTVFMLSQVKKALILTPLVVYDIMLALTPLTGWIFFINESNQYVRGTFYYFSYILNFYYLMMVIVTELVGLRYEKLGFRKRQNLFLSVFTGITILAGLIQAYFNTIWLAYPCTAIAELLIYCYIQKRHLTTDALTGVHNRGSFDRYIIEQFEQSYEHNTLCLFMLDLDRFKQINDTFGHDTGDRALIQTAVLLGNLFRKTDAFLARYGGDEFCIVYHCMDDLEAENIIKQISLAFDAQNASDGEPYTLLASVGYSFRNQPDMTPKEMVMAADKMMYENKQRRRGL